jgi:hypothetical protein
MWTDEVPAVRRVVKAGSLRRAARLHDRIQEVSPDDAENLKRYNRYFESAVSASLARFAPISTAGLTETPINRTPGTFTGDSALVFVRNSRLKGPMSVFGYNYLTDKLGAERAGALKLLSFTGLRGSGGDYAYEVLNLAGPFRRAIDIRNEVSAIYGAVPLEMVVEFLRALEKVGVVRQSR